MLVACEVPLEPPPAVLVKSALFQTPPILMSAWNWLGVRVVEFE